MLRILAHFTGIVLLTLLTQIGGLVYLAVVLLISRSSANYHWKRFGAFTGAYLLITFVVVPPMAKLFGREKIDKTERIQPLHFLTDLANRNYVVPELNLVLQKTARRLSTTLPSAKIQYLDANFPFFDGFPLLPHLSHDDGRKLDLAFLYEKEGVISDKTPSIVGYGNYVLPKANEVNTAVNCKKRGYWQYDFTKFVGIRFSK